LDAIDRNTQAQARLVDDLLDSQRVLCGDLRLAIGEVPLGTLLDEALEQVRPAAHLKRISLEVEHDAGLDALQVDALRLCQALVKLLANAVKFTPEEGVVQEDDDDAREVLELILREAQAEPHSFDRASHAYKYLAQADVRERPDALISDIAMPDEDGYAFLRRVRELEAREGRGHVVALALTAFARSEDRARALAAGFDAHAAKPIDSERVVST